MRLEHLRYFLEVVRCRSISQASRNLFIGQSTLSSAMSALEDELQVQLFHRTNKGIALTMAGEELLPDIGMMVACAERLEQARDDVTFLHKHNIHLAAYPSGMLSAFAAILPEMVVAHPQVNFHLTEVKPEGILRELLLTNTSIGLSALSEVRYHVLQKEAAFQGFACVPLFHDRFSLYVPANDGLAQADAVDLTVLRDRPMAVLKAWILPEENSFYPIFHTLNKVHSFSGFASLKKAVAYGGLCALAPRLSFYHDLYIQSGLITEVPLCGFAEKLQVFLLYRPHLLDGGQAEIDWIDGLQRFYAGLDEAGWV